MPSSDPVLLVAYQCGPGMGSVSHIGWQWFLGTAARQPTCLVTHVRNRAAIEASPERPADARIIYIDTERFAGPLYRLAKALFPRSEHAVFMVSQLDWFAFDAVVVRRLRQELRQGAPWRLVHVVTPVTVSAPTRLHRLGLPVVRGPLNCGLPVPPGFAELMRHDAMGLSRLRIFPRLIEAVFSSLRGSARVLVATQATADALPVSARPRQLRMLENAIDPRRFSATPPAPREGRPLRVCFVGRLVPVKALNLLLQALATLREQGRAIELDAVGDGPMAGAWQDLSTQLGLQAQVRWHGALDGAAVARQMAASDLLCLPSVRESGGAVLLEAMACGRPVIGMDFGGPAEVVDSDVGWKVAMPDAPAAVAGLVSALAEAHDDEAGCRSRGEAARARALACHTWDARFNAAQALYREVIAEAGEPPSAHSSPAPGSPAR